MTLVANHAVNFPSFPSRFSCHSHSPDPHPHDDRNEEADYFADSVPDQLSSVPGDLGCLINVYRQQISQVMASVNLGDAALQSAAATDTDSVKFNAQTEELVFTGGLQQFLIREARKQKDQQLSQQPRRCDGTSPVLTFHDLPDSLQLHICSFLDAVDLCRISTVCKHWLMISSDELLWQVRLQNDMDTWQIITNNSNPDSFTDSKEDWLSKEIYLRCSPVVTDMVRKGNRNFTQLSSIFRSLLPKRTPKIALFGPGLESSTSGLVRKIIEPTTDLFCTVGMFPGNHGGVGSGFTIKMASSLMFHLSTLYAANRQDRESWQQGQRLKNHRLLEQVNGEEEQKFILKDNVREFCKSLDAFIFAVDATQDENTVADSRGELTALLEAVTDKVNLPLLVLSCTPDVNSQKHLSCVEVVQSLQLSKINRPWQVHHCVVDDLTGLENAFRWIIEHCNRR